MLIAAEYPLAGSVPLLRREAAPRLPGGEGGCRRPGSLRLAQVSAAGCRRGEIQIDPTTVHSSRARPTRRRRPDTTPRRRACRSRPPRAVATVGAFRLFPGLAPDLLRNVLHPPLQGVSARGVWRRQRPRSGCRAPGGAGQGDLPRCGDGGNHPVLGGRCVWVSTPAGSALAKAGVISGYDMSAEAALCKLFYLFSQGLPPETVASEDSRRPLRRADAAACAIALTCGDSYPRRASHLTR